MSKVQKYIEKLKTKSNNLTYDEAKKILISLGFNENNKGKTSGSRVEFVNNDNKKIELHKPHPENKLKLYQIRKILKSLEEWRIL